MTQVLVDSSFYISSALDTDINHELALRIGSTIKQNQITTDDFLKETLTILSQRVSKHFCIEFYKKLLTNTTVISVTPDHLNTALGMFLNPKTNKDISLIDCTGAAIYEQINATSILTFDKHFKTLGCKIHSLKV